MATFEIDGALNEDRDMRAAVAALTTLAEHGVSLDIQELLVHGDDRGTVKPGALSKMVQAILVEFRR